MGKGNKSASNSSSIPADILRQVDDIGQQLDLQERIATLQAKVNSLSTQNQALLERAGSFKEFMAQVKQAVVALEPYPHIPYSRGEKASSNIAAVTDISDWHIGERIMADETEGFNAYDWQIAQARAFGYADEFIEWVHTQREAYRIDELWVIMKGDHISGDIHDELRRTNEWPIPVQTAKAGNLIAEWISRMAAHFAAVHVVEIGADNHSRLVQKPQAKQKSTNSMSYLVHEIVNSRLEKHGNVEIIQPNSMKFVQEIARHKFLIEHGDTTKAWMGIPYYGMERTRAREAVKRMGTDKEFDYISIGHWHVPAIISGNIYVNGSLSGTSEFDHSQGRHSAPAQVSYLVHPKHGIFNWTAWRFRK